MVILSRYIESFEEIIFPDIKDNSKFQMSMTPSCLTAIQRMNSCPVCDGLAESKPCSNFCLNVMNGCLAHRIELQKDWDKFAGKISKFLKNSFL